MSTLSSHRIHLPYNHSIGTLKFESYQNFHHSSSSYTEEDRKPSSQVEKSVQAIRDKANEVQSEIKVIAKKSLYIRIKEELIHYYHGFKLLFIDVRLCSRYVWRILKGDGLSRREHRQVGVVITYAQ